jgi:heat shock protein HtpX
MSAMKTTLLLATLTGLFLVVARRSVGRQGMTIALVLAAAMNFVSLFWSDKIVLSMYRARPVGPAEAPELHAVVEKLAMKAGIPMPRLYIIPDAALNAFATGRSPSHAAVAATEGILRALTRDELEGVLAHELSHVLNRDTLISTVGRHAGGAISHLARFAYFMPTGRSRQRRPRAVRWVGCMALILAPIAAMLIQLAVSRSREYAADATGAKLVGYPDGPHRALRSCRPPRTRIPMRAADPATAPPVHREPALRALPGRPLQHPPAGRSRGSSGSWR